MVFSLLGLPRAACKRRLHAAEPGFRRPAGGQAVGLTLALSSSARAHQGFRRSTREVRNSSGPSIKRFLRSDLSSPDASESAWRSSSFPAKEQALADWPDARVRRARGLARPSFTRRK